MQLDISPEQQEAERLAVSEVTQGIYFRMEWHRYREWSVDLENLYTDQELRVVHLHGTSVHGESLSDLIEALNKYLSLDGEAREEAHLSLQYQWARRLEEMVEEDSPYLRRLMKRRQDKKVESTLPNLLKKFEWFVINTNSEVVTLKAFSGGPLGKLCEALQMRGSHDSRQFEGGRVRIDDRTLTLILSDASLASKWGLKIAAKESKQNLQRLQETLLNLEETLLNLDSQRALLLQKVQRFEGILAPQNIDSKGNIKSLIV